MITCPNCKTDNMAGSRFCEQCGADLRAVSSASGLPTYGSAQQSRPSMAPTSTWSAQGPSTPQPAPKRKRRGCLWTVIILLLLCVLVSGLSYGWSRTDSGKNFISTVEAELTQQAEPSSEATNAPAADATRTTEATGSNLKTNVAATLTAEPQTTPTPTP